jgi:hypothetical protein
VEIILNKNGWMRGRMLRYLEVELFSCRDSYIWLPINIS